MNILKDYCYRCDGLLPMYYNKFITDAIHFTYYKSI